MSCGTRILYRRVMKASSALSMKSGAGGTTAVSPDRPSEANQRQDVCYSTSSSPPPLHEIKGVIFDMDGTLTIPVLQFNEMRLRLGLSPSQDILTTVQSYPPVQQAEAMAIIEEMEEEAIRIMQLQSGVLELLHYIAEKKVRRALMTRNSTKATNAFLLHLNNQLSDCQDRYPHLKKNHIFSEVITRDFVPCKPDPSGVLHICSQWELEPHEVAVVGDDKVDMICGIRAGTALNILLKNERNQQQVDYSNFTVDSLLDIITLFSAPMEVTPKQEPLPV